MKTLIAVIAGSAFLAFAGAACADDHLAQAQEHGLAAGSVGSEHVRDNGAGQGSPFFGEDQVTPSSDHGQAHANVKDRSG